MSERTVGFAWVAVAYLAALAAGAGTVAALGADGGLWTAFWADVVGTLVVFGFSRWLDNTSVYDPYWSVAPLALAAWWALVLDGDPQRTTLVRFLITAWGVRLTLNWASGWPGLHHEDWRYVAFRKHGRWYWPISLAGLHLFPTVQVFLGMLPVWVALGSDTPVGALDYVAALVTAGAIAIETVADLQLRAFVERGEGGICEDGLWYWSRHPNYLGEIGFWFGLALFGFAADPSAWWAWTGVVAIGVMFVTVSVPLLDRRSLERRPGYAEHMQRVSSIVPWPRRDT